MNQIIVRRNTHLAICNMVGNLRCTWQSQMYLAICDAFCNLRWSRQWGGMGIGQTLYSGHWSQPVSPSSNKTTEDEPPTIQTQTESWLDWRKHLSTRRKTKCKKKAVSLVSILSHLEQKNNWRRWTMNIQQFRHTCFSPSLCCQISRQSSVCLYILILECTCPPPEMVQTFSKLWWDWELEE